MKKYIVIGLFILGAGVAVLLHNPDCANAYGFGCGLKPLTPMGCDSRSATCVCDSNDNCSWVWNCN